MAEIIKNKYPNFEYSKLTATSIPPTMPVNVPSQPKVLFIDFKIVGDVCDFAQHN